MFQFFYIKLLGVNVRHSFYSDMESPDFSFTPTLRTANILAAYSLKFKEINGRLMIFQQRDENNLPFQEIDALIDLYFVMRVKTDILNVTDSYSAGRYWFSNLKEDGSYANILTQNASHSANDQLPPIYTQAFVVNLNPGDIKSISLKKIIPGVGWSETNSFTIDPAATSIKIELNSGGYYQMEKELKAGGSDISKIIISDDISKAAEIWSLVHIQLKEGDSNLQMVIPLTSKSSAWHYYLVEPKARATVPPIAAANLAIKYSASADSRYPPAMNINFKQPQNYSDSEKKYTDAILADTKVKNVYLFESAGTLTIQDGEQPSLKILLSNAALAEKVTIPARSNNSTSIIYKL